MEYKVCGYMVEKKFRHLIAVSPESTSFKNVDRNLVAWYDEDLLQKHLPPTAGVTTADGLLAKSLSNYLPEETVDALNATDFVGVFGRIVQRKDQKGPLCLQYLYVWDYQAVPVHEGDYEPIYVYVDGHDRYAIYDLVHYCTRRIDLGKTGKDGPGLRVVPGWHSFLPATLKTSVVDKGLEVKPLSDQHLESWWNIPEDHPRLKIKGFITDPFRLKAPGHFMDEPDEEARTMCCTFKELESAFKEFENPREALIEGLKRAFSGCIGIFALHRLSTFISLMGEMDNVGMIRIPSALRSGLNIANIGTLLSEGFASLTEGGKNLLSGFRNSE